MVAVMVNPRVSLGANYAVTVGMTIRFSLGFKMWVILKAIVGMN
jgi:hypothetical protein